MNLNLPTNRGWNIIPIAAGSKVPPAGLDLDKYFYEKFPPEQLKNWSGNFAIVTGSTSGVVVIDIDDLSKTDKYLATNPGVVVSTPSGGYHLYFSMPSIKIPEIRVLESGVECYAGKHPVLIPPSSVKNMTRGAREYSGEYTYVRNESLTQLPQWIIEKLTSENVSSGKYSQAEIKQLLDYAFKHGHFQEGAHNDAIFYGSMYLLGEGMSIDVARSLMLGFDARDPSPQGEGVVNSIVDRAHSSYAKPLDKSASTVRGSKTTFDVIDYAVMADKYYDHDVKWLIDGWLLEAGVLMIAAPPERFKTWLAVDMALSIASGAPFLDHYEVNKRGKVLVIQQEDYGANLYKRFRVVEAHKLDKYPIEPDYSEDGGKISIKFNWCPEDLIFFHPDGQLSLDNLESVNMLAKKIEEIRPEVVIIDPFYSLSTTDDYYATAAAQIRQFLKPLRDKYGCAFVFIHHSKKTKEGEGDSTVRNAIYGSQFVNAVMEGAVVVSQPRGAPDGTITAYRRFKDAPPQPPVQIVFSIDDKYNVSVDEEADSLESDIMDFLMSNGPTPLKDLWEEFGEQFSSKARLGELLKRMSNVVQNGKRQYMIAPVVVS